MIFYFSATGNSKKLAEIIANKTSDKAIDIEEAAKNKAFDYQLENGERLGFAFPVFWGNVPWVFEDFVKQLTVKSGDNYYGYIAVTDGGMSEAAPLYLQRILVKRGITINAVFGLKTVDTCALFANKWDPQSWGSLPSEVELKSSMIAQMVLDRTLGEYAQPSIFPRVTTFLMRPAYKLFQSTRSFSVTDKCTHCGLCANKCPVGAIEIQDGLPKWVKPRCMTCMRCLHHCPADAIEFGNYTQGKPRYHKPI